MVFENIKVPCLGCKEDVNRSDAEFCLLDNGLYCYFCKDCIRKIQKGNTQQKNKQTKKKETDLTEISKFEWKEKTCEDIIEDVKKCLFDFPLHKNRKPPMIAHRGLFFVASPTTLFFF